MPEDKKQRSLLFKLFTGAAKRSGETGTNGVGEQQPAQEHSVPVQPQGTEAEDILNRMRKETQDKIAGLLHETATPAVVDVPAPAQQQPAPPQEERAATEDILEQIPREAQSEETDILRETTAPTNGAAAAPQQPDGKNDVSLAQAGEQPATSTSDEVKPPPVDALIRVSIISTGLEAYVEVLPPSNGGAEANPRTVRAAIIAAGVTVGIMDRVLVEMVKNKPYGKGKILVAQGIPKQDGMNGFVTEHFSREVALKPTIKEDGTVDFKQLDVIREIVKGTLIATLTQPTEGTIGTGVKGEPLRPLPGRPVQLMRGENTVVSEDGLTLLAAANGHLRYSGDRFTIDTTYVVEGNVDNNTGNISFCGNILVKGDVREGYEVRSGGSVRIKSTVEGGSIFAEGDVVVDGGFNGMKRGEISSQGSITSKFLQNCTVYAKEAITTEAIINSVVDCDGHIVVTRAKGVIVGGKITALHYVEANTIGSDVNTPTNISVGLSPTILKERAEMENEAKAVQEGNEELRKNQIYLERCAKMGPLSPKNQTLYDSCNKQKILLLAREAKCTRRLNELNAIIEEAAAGSYVKARVFYPSTKVSIQSISHVIKIVQNRSTFRREDGEIKVFTT